MDKEQKHLIEEFEKHCGFEFMRKEDVRANRKEEFIEMFEYNVQWLNNLASECDSIINDYRNRYG